MNENVISNQKKKEWLKLKSQEITANKKKIPKINSELNNARLRKDGAEKYKFVIVRYHSYKGNKKLIKFILKSKPIYKPELQAFIFNASNEHKRFGLNINKCHILSKYRYLLSSIKSFLSNSFFFLFFLLMKIKLFQIILIKLKINLKSLQNKIF